MIWNALAPMWRNGCKMDIFHFNLCNCADILGRLLHIVLSKPVVRNFRDCLNLLYPAWVLYLWVSIIFLSVTGIFVYFQDNYIDEKLLATLRDKPITSWDSWALLQWSLKVRCWFVVSFNCCSSDPIRLCATACEIFVIHCDFLFAYSLYFNVFMLHRITIYCF